MTGSVCLKVSSCAVDSETLETRRNHCEFGLNYQEDHWFKFRRPD